MTAAFVVFVGAVAVAFVVISGAVERLEERIEKLEGKKR